MSTEISFAQALTESRQIIVQQSNRIKADLDRIKSMQETIGGQTAAMAENDRTIRQSATDIDSLHEQVRSLTAKLDGTRVAKEQAEAVIDRQGQRISQMQDAVVTLEARVSEQDERIDHLLRELDATRGQLPTQEDHDALTALASLLSAKKGASRQPHAPADEPVAAAA